MGTPRQWLLIAAWLCGACADLLEIPESPYLAAPDPWQCESSLDLQQAASARPAFARVVVRACNFDSADCASTVTGLSAALCNKRDYNCSAPIESGLRDVAGDFSFAVPTSGSLGLGFDGYLLISAPRDACTSEATFGAGTSACLLAPDCDPSAPDDTCSVPTFFPGLVFFNPPITADVLRPIEVPLVPSSRGISLVVADGARRTEAASLGVVIATGRDCSGSPAAGLTFDSSPSSPRLEAVYQARGVISTTATETDASGVGGLLGVPPGFVRIGASIERATEQREVAHTGVQVLPASITYASLSPTAP